MYNNDPKYMNPQQGLASLVNSPYGDSDVMRVKMTPREVAGLQQLAMSYGANQRDLYDPVTGEPRFSFLKKILPMIAGAILPGIPGVGAFAKTIGFGSQALGSALLVGGVTGLIEGDLKKGLMAGLGAYSGAKIGEAFTAAGTPVPAPTAPATEVAPTPKLPGTPSLKESILGGPDTRVFDTTGAATWSAGQPGQAPITQAVQAATTVKPPPTGFFDTMGQGVRNVFASGDAGDASRSAFMKTFENPFVRSATLMGGLAALTPEQKALDIPGADEDTFYVHGGFNPLYGTGAGQPMFLPGKHYKRTKKGVFEYNPYGPIRGAAMGGLMQAQDQQGSIPQPSVPYPKPNQNYPLSTVAQTNYAPNAPRGRELVNGYEPKIDPFTGEERFANGGAVNPFVTSKETYEELAKKDPFYKQFYNPISDFYSPRYGINEQEAFDTRQRYQNFLAQNQGNPNAYFAEFEKSGVPAGVLREGESYTSAIRPINAPAQNPFTEVAGRETALPYGVTTPSASVMTAASPFTGEAIGAPVMAPTSPSKTKTFKPRAGTVPPMNEDYFIQPEPVLEDRNVEANRKYVEELNRRAKNPTFTPYGSIAGGGFGGIYTGGNPYGPPLDTGGGQTTTGGGAGDVAAFLATQVGINWLMQPGNASALQKWISGGMKWSERPFLNADKTVTPPGGTTTTPGGTNTTTGGETGGQQTQTGGETGGQQTTTGGESQPYYDPLKNIVVAGGTGAAAVAAAQALAAKIAGTTKMATVGIQLVDGSIIPVSSSAITGGAAGAGAAGAGTGAATTGGATAAGGAGAGGGGAAAGGAGGAGTTGGIGGAGFPGGAAGAGLAALLGAQQAYQGISKGKEGQAALGGALAGAGTAAFLGGTAPAVLGGANLATLAGFGPVGLAAAAIAAIGASLVNTKEYGDVALRNYWNAVDQGRGLGAAPPEELAQGFINFYRTNKNEFAGQAKYGRTGNEDFIYDMTQVINNAVKDGKVNKDVDAATMYKQVVQPWLNSMGEGPKNEDAKRIQDFMMTDLINNFMRGAPISNAQVKGDKKYKIVSEKPVYAGTPPDALQRGEMGGMYGQMPAGFQGRPSGIPAGINPYADTGREYIPRGGEEQFLAEGGSIGEDYNFGFAGGGMPEYQAGGTLLNGPGDGMSDSIPAVIRGKGVQRAALADGEFVVPADVVSHLGNGSTNAGAKKLYGMMDKIRQARTGKTGQAPAVRTDRYLPA